MPTDFPQPNCGRPLPGRRRRVHSFANWRGWGVVIALPFPRLRAADGRREAKRAERRQFGGTQFQALDSLKASRQKGAGIGSSTEAARGLSGEQLHSRYALLLGLRVMAVIIAGLVVGMAPIRIGPATV